MQRLLIKMIRTSFSEGRYWIYPISTNVITGAFKILPGGGDSDPCQDFLVDLGGQFNFKNIEILKALKGTSATNPGSSDCVAWKGVICHPLLAEEHEELDMEFGVKYFDQFKLNLPLPFANNSSFRVSSSFQSP